MQFSPPTLYKAKVSKKITILVMFLIPILNNTFYEGTYRSVIWDLVKVRSFGHKKTTPRPSRSSKKAGEVACLKF